VQAGFSNASTAWLTALAAAVNMIGNVASGRLLNRNIQAQTLLYIGFCVMGLTAFVAFVPIATHWATQLNFSLGTDLIPIIRYIAILLFSMVGGLIPGTLFSLSVALAPNRDTVSTTVGWMQQWSALGQFSGPPLVAWVAASAGGWQWTWLVTSTCAMAGLCLAWQMGKQIQRSKNAVTA
jgi:CP family cyanate transporter-like MFS transporter